MMLIKVCWTKRAAIVGLLHGSAAHSLPSVCGLDLGCSHTRLAASSSGRFGIDGNCASQLSSLVQLPGRNTGRRSSRLITRRSVAIDHVGSRRSAICAARYSMLEAAPGTSTSRVVHEGWRRRSTAAVRGSLNVPLSDRRRRVLGRTSTTKSKPRSESSSVQCATIFSLPCGWIRRRVPNAAMPCAAFGIGEQHKRTTNTVASSEVRACDLAPARLRNRPEGCESRHRQWPAPHFPAIHK
jgi:hypothetical protein